MTTSRKKSPEAVTVAKSIVTQMTFLSVFNENIYMIQNSNLLLSTINASNKINAFIVYVWHQPKL